MQIYGLQNKDLHPTLQSSGSGGQAQGRPQEYASSPGYGCGGDGQGEKIAGIF